MRVLIVCSGNAPAGQKFHMRLHHAFIYEQVEELKNLGIDFEYFLVTEKGLRGYLKSIFRLRKLLKHKSFDIVHGHYGLSSAISVFQRKHPVVATFHGCDVNRKILNAISSFASVFARANIIVTEGMSKKIFIKTPWKSSVIPCGIDTSLFYPVEKSEARKALGLDQSKTYILFSSSKDTPVKNYPLARKAADNFPGSELLEICNRTREEVNLLMNACDIFLMTSFREGSPLTIKEALATNLPIVSTDIGDVRWLIGNTPGCYLCSFEMEDVVDKIRMALEFSKTVGRTNGRARISELGIDAGSIAKRVLAVYEKVLKIEDYKIKD